MWLQCHRFSLFLLRFSKFGVVGEIFLLLLWALRTIFRNFILPVFLYLSPVTVVLLKKKAADLLTLRFWKLILFTLFFM